MSQLDPDLPLANHAPAWLRNVSPAASHFEQWSALAHAYWRSKLNRWVSDSIISRAIQSIFLGLLIAAVLIWFGVLFGGGYVLAKSTADGKAFAAVGAWNALCGGFLFLWLIGLANDATRGDSLSLQKLMHLPISPASVFALNFLLTWINLPIVFFLSSGLGLVLGGCLVEGIAGLWKLAPVLSYALMVSALTSQVQGKLQVLLQNPKTRSMLMTAIPIFLTVLGLGISMSSFFIRRLAAGGNTLYWTQIIDAACPFFWLADILSGRSLLGAYCWIWMPCMWLISAWSLRANYRMTKRFYQHGFDLESSNASVGKSERPNVANEGSANGSVRWMERSFPGLSQPASAIAAMTWTLFWRSPQMKLAMLLPILQPFFLLLVFQQKPTLSEPSNPPVSAVVEPDIDVEPTVWKGTQYQGFYLFAITVFSTYLGSSFASNIFGFDRSGFRFWVLSSIPRSDILKGRNWMFGAMLLVIVLALLIFTNILWSYSWLRVVEALAAFLAYLPLYLALSNVIAILAPFPVPVQGFQGAKDFSWKSLVLNMALSSLMPVILTLCSVPWGIEWGIHKLQPAFRSVPIALLCMPFLIGLAWWLYGRLIELIGQLLQSQQENLLKVVTSKSEK
jgi:hypothetical protein